MTTTRRRHEENHAKKCITTVMNILNLFQKGSSRNVLSLKWGKKGVIFLATKVLVLAKIGGDFSPKISEKGYLFNARNEHGNH